MIVTQLKNLIIGLFVMIACFIIVGIILFVKPQVGDGKQIIHIYFSDINGLNIGTRVTYAGKPIGEVENIEQVPEARQKAVNHFGEVYPYVLTLKIDSSFVIYTTDKITIQTAGLLGEKYIAIIPEPFTAGRVAKIVTPEDVLYGESADILQSAMDKLAALSEKAEEALDRVIVWVDKYGDNLGSLVRSTEYAVEAVGKILKTFDEQNVAEDIAKVAKNVNSITSTIAEGRGTLGRIIEEDGLYLQFNSLLSKTNTLIDDVNQYGLLFQYNKTWQRKRVKLMNEASRVKSPKAFQAYMDAQIDEINVTLSRMKELTQRFQLKDLATNQRYRNCFALFMQELSSLQERVKLYNDELNQMKYKEECP